MGNPYSISNITPDFNRACSLGSIKTWGSGGKR